MTRHGSLITLKPEYEERYIILHKHTFPGVLEQIRKSNIQNYSIFLRDFIQGKMLFSYFEYTGNDLKADMAKMAEDSITQEWWKLTDSMQVPLETHKKSEWWTSIEEIFHTGGIKKPSVEAQRHASVVDLCPEFQEEYRKLHTEVSPVVLEQIQKSNIRNYSIFLHECRLYSYFEYIGGDFKEDMDEMFCDTATLKWWDICKTLRKIIPTVREDEWWAKMREVFHTD